MDDKGAFSCRIICVKVVEKHKNTERIGASMMYLEKGVARWIGIQDT